MSMAAPPTPTRNDASASAATDDRPNPEPFARFFEHWLQEQDRDLQTLRSSAASGSPSSHDEDSRLRPLVDRVLAQYDNYYSNKSDSAKRDVVPMFSPPWTSSSEGLFLWAGGWRPSLAFHLLYSKSGLQLESQLEKLIRGIRSRDLADLTPQQLEKIDQLQRKTIKMEKEISEEEAKAQEKVADARMLEVAGAITERGGRGGEGEGEEMMRPEMEKKEREMERVLERADGLRMETLKGVVGILRPMQAVQFLIAAAELHLRIHEFGKSKDEQQNKPAGAGAGAGAAGW